MCSFTSRTTVFQLTFYYIVVLYACFVSLINIKKKKKKKKDFDNIYIVCIYAGFLLRVFPI